MRRTPTISASAATTTISSYSPPQREKKPWIDPASLPSHGSVAHIAGNASEHIKRLTQNTFFAYGVGTPPSAASAASSEWSGDDFFGYAVGRRVRLADISVYASGERMEASTTAEIEVTRGMLNGAGMLHGGCVAYLVDNCCSTPLVVLGLAQGRNGVGVTQAMHVLFHSPAAVGTTLSIVSTSVSLGSRVMSSRCEIIAKETGRIV
ncbi:thioesterase PaaI family protein, partial [Pleurotus pulmonarius]